MGAGCTGGAYARAAGAEWDGNTKRWYVPETTAAADSARWLGDGLYEAEFGLSSEEAYVASAVTACTRCQADIEVIWLYYERGVNEEIGQAILRATLSNL